MSDLRPDGKRDPIAGPASPETPYPIRIQGQIVKGFQRGSRQLGFPTANLDQSCLDPANCDPAAQTLPDGVYFGWVGLDFFSRPVPSPAGDSSPDPLLAAGPLPGRASGRVFPTALSVGKNPYFNNDARTVEMYIMHDFTAAAAGQDAGLEAPVRYSAEELFQFYGAHARLAILGFIRPQYDYTTQEALIDDILTDVAVTRHSLSRPDYGRNLFRLAKEGGEEEENASELLRWLVTFSS